MSHKDEIIVEKHPLFIRWTHWVNFPLLLMMIWSGGMIYWANHVYWPHFSDSFFNFLNLKYRLAEGMSYHFFFMWLFTINGILYFFYLVFSGEWRELIPLRISISSEKFNGAQRIAYTSIMIMGLGSLITGLAIYKPIQLNWLKNSLGGYETARLIHFYLTIGFILFFFIHVTQVIKAGWNTFRAMVTEKKRSLVAFSILIFWFLIFFGGFKWMTSQQSIAGAPAPLRKALELNEGIWMTVLNPDKVDHPPLSTPTLGKKGRVNGDLGLNSDDDMASWAITVASPMTQIPPKEIIIPLDELKKLPQIDLVTQLKCIEGWSEVRSYGGVRFIDFLNHFHLGTHSGKTIDYENHPEDLFSYVGLETPDEEYYVSIDMVSMLAPDTLLAFDMNGAPLSRPNGSPVRLAISNKYGVKNLKRIGKIQFSDSKLPDYWGEQGYDWFIGL